MKFSRCVLLSVSSTESHVLNENSSLVDEPSESKDTTLIRWEFAAFSKHNTRFWPNFLIKIYARLETCCCLGADIWFESN